MSEADIEIARRSFVAFNARDVDELVGLCAPDCEWLPFRAQLEGTTYRGHEGVRRFIHDIDEDWRSYRIDPAEFHERGAQVAVVGRVEAVGRGSDVMMDSLAGFVVELRAGLITRVVSHSKPEAALEAVGLGR